MAKPLFDGDLVYALVISGKRGYRKRVRFAAPFFTDKEREIVLHHLQQEIADMMAARITDLTLTCASSVKLATLSDETDSRKR